MNLTMKDIIKVITESDYELDTEHNRGSTFFATAELIITDEEIEQFKDEFDLSVYKGMNFVASGMWDDTWGSEFDEAWIEKPVTVHVPEQIIPAHDIIEWKRIDD